MNHLAVVSPLISSRLLRQQPSTHRSASLNSSPPISATSTRAAPTRKRRVSSSPGARAPASRRSTMCGLCMSRPTSSRLAANDQCRPSSSASRRAVICSTGFVTGQIIPVNPAASVRGPSHSVQCGRTPILDPAEAGALLDSIDVAMPAGLRDRALIGLMVCSFARIGAALSMKIEEV
jgi:hypothetical protein